MHIKHHLPLLIATIALISACTPTQDKTPKEDDKDQKEELEDLQIIGMDLNVYGDNNEIQILNAEEGEVERLHHRC